MAERQNWQISQHLGAFVQQYDPNGTSGQLLNGQIEGDMLWEPAAPLQYAQEDLQSLLALHQPAIQMPNMNPTSIPYPFQLISSQLDVQRYMGSLNQNQNRLPPIPYPLYLPNNAIENQNQDQNTFQLQAQFQALVPKEEVQDHYQNQLPLLSEALSVASSEASTQTPPQEHGQNATTVSVDMFLRMRAEKERFEFEARQMNRGEAMRKSHWQKKNEEFRRKYDIWEREVRAFEINTAERTQQLNRREAQVQARMREEASVIRARASELDARDAMLKQSVENFEVLKRDLEEAMLKFNQEKEQMEVWQKEFIKIRDIAVGEINDKQKRLEDAIELNQNSQRNYEEAWQEFKKEEEEFIHQRDRYTQYERAKTKELDEREAAVESKEIRLRSMRLEIRDQRKQEVEMRLDKQKLEKELEEVKTRLQELREERDQVVKREKDWEKTMMEADEKVKKQEKDLEYREKKLEAEEEKIQKASEELENRKKKLEVEQKSISQKALDIEDREKIVNTALEYVASQKEKLTADEKELEIKKKTLHEDQEEFREKETEKIKELNERDWNVKETNRRLEEAIAKLNEEAERHQADVEQIKRREEIVAEFEISWAKSVKEADEAENIRIKNLEIREKKLAAEEMELEMKKALFQKEQFDNRIKAKENEKRESEEDVAQTVKKRKQAIKRKEVESAQGIEC